MRLRPERAGERSLVVASEELSAYDPDSLAVLWGSLAGRVGLALDRPRTDRRPAEKIGDVLRRDRIEHLAAAGHAEIVDLAEDRARQPQTGFDVA